MTPSTPPPTPPEGYEYVGSRMRKALNDRGVRRHESILRWNDLTHRWEEARFSTAFSSWGYPDWLPIWNDQHYAVKIARS